MFSEGVSQTSAITNKGYQLSNMKGQTMEEVKEFEDILVTSQTIIN